MAWDDELERLAVQVDGLCGADVHGGAVARALTAAWQHARPIREAELRVIGVTSSDGDWAPMSVFYAALKREYRRLLTEH